MQHVYTFIVSLIGEVICIPIQGITLMILWNWFLPELGVHLISLYGAIGLILVALAIKNVSVSDIQNNQPVTVINAVHHVLARILVSGILLGIGYIITIF